ncbi:phage tail protein [Pseudomonas sp. 6D_7.1_Bac1]|uniref:phage tail protein n=1 Tax=Pseudomonas sp. 6D_7.1_Bac1 TaxID=2971615 RepID=UPI0021CA5288|nr:phage tail protein [Pseudomonas sp. 6D_7.1_Bac1]MCU1751595.1 phage tail protein [Pseudomonas sp. 6D_7.1_Bac1]
MIDANSQFFAILTNVGMAKQANADALGIPWKITEMGVGDANNTDPIPSATQKKLINEWRRRPLNQLRVDPVNPAVIIAEQIIPADEGGRWIREIALYDADGDMVAVANCAPSFKPVLSQGSGRTQVVRMNFIVTSTGNITLKIDPAVVLATREYVDTAIINVLPPNKAPGTYTRVTINERGIVQSGSNPTTLGGYGITDAFSRSGGDVSGPVSLLEACSVNVVAATSQSWAAGVHAVTKNERKIIGGFGAWGANDTLNNVYMGIGSEPWYSGYGVRVNTAGTTITGPLIASGAGLTNLRWGAIYDPPNTLAGYGVAFASQTEAEAGADTNKPMNALRVWQAIAAKVVQATESVRGIANIASQAWVNAGTDDTSIVTPKKMRWGFATSKGAPGYILFPTWLGSLMIQWGTAGTVAAGSGITVTYPIAFPNNMAMTLVGNSFSNGGTTATSSLGVQYGGLTQFYVYAIGSLGQPNAPWIAVGW